MQFKIVWDWQIASTQRIAMYFNPILLSHIYILALLKAVGDLGVALGVSVFHNVKDV